jgi:hypothetical protein
MMRKSASISMLAAVLTLVPFARAAHVLKYGSHSRELIVVPDPYSSSDITPYIQQGVNILKAAKGGTLVLSAGTYLIGDKDIAIRIDSASGILIRGDGDATVLKQMQMPRTNARYFFYLRKSSGITFENLRFEGVRVTGVDGDGGTETAIQAVDSYRDLRIRSCSFKFFKTGAIRLRGFPTQSRITNCAFESVDNAVDNLNYFGAIEVESGKDILILDNHFSGQRHSAIFLRRCESITVSGNDAVFDATGYHPQCRAKMHLQREPILQSGAWAQPAIQGIDWHPHRGQHNWPQYHPGPLFRNQPELYRRVRYRNPFPCRLPQFDNQQLDQRGTDGYRRGFG